MLMISLGVAAVGAYLIYRLVKMSLTTGRKDGFVMASLIGLVILLGVTALLNGAGLAKPKTTPTVAKSSKTNTSEPSRQTSEAERQRRANEESERKAQETEKQRMAVAQKQKDMMINEITTGWNMETTDTSSDNSNFRKATSLVVKYPNYIHEAAANYIDVNDAMKKPWNYYGQVVNLSGRVYSIEQLPPGHPASKFFGSDCYTAMLAVNDDVAVSMYIVGDSTGISEDSQLNVKGYIYGHAALVNRLGGKSRGLDFVGFNE